MVLLGRRAEQRAGEADRLAAELPGWATEIVVLGCHGGAGTTTLRVLLDSPWELGTYAAERSEIGTFGRPLALTTRNSVAASARAVEVVNVLAANEITPAVLVVMADGAGPEPDEAVARFRMLEGRVGKIIRFPFVTGLRFLDAGLADQVRLPTRAQQALVEIRRACYQATHESLLRESQKRQAEEVER